MHFRFYGWRHICSRAKVTGRHRPAEAQCTRSLGLGYKLCRPTDARDCFSGAYSNFPGGNIGGGVCGLWLAKRAETSISVRDEHARRPASCCRQDKLAVDRHRYCQFSWPTTVQHIGVTLCVCTFVELSWQHVADWRMAKFYKSGVWDKVSRYSVVTWISLKHSVRGSQIISMPTRVRCVQTFWQICDRHIQTPQT